MGIPGLLPKLKSITDDIHISEYAGLTVAVDALCWLHRGVFCCATELALGELTTKHLDFCINRVNLLLRHNVKPLLVFDGGKLPEKCLTDDSRRSTRAENKAKGLIFHQEGNFRAAEKCFQQACSVTPEMSHQLIERLKKLNVEFLVAPYESDAQLAYLSQQGLVAAVISEDSDLIVFGCHRVMYKLDNGGNGKQLRLRLLGCNESLRFENWDQQMLQRMCILSGCDYLESLPGMGLKRAHAYSAAAKSTDLLIHALRRDGWKLPPHYELNFTKALLTFMHQRVYDPLTRQMVHLTPVPDSVRAQFADLSFLGPDLPPTICQGIAESELHPVTFLPYNSLPSSGTSLPSRNDKLVLSSTKLISSVQNLPQQIAALSTHPKENKQPPVVQIQPSSDPLLAPAASLPLVTSSYFGSDSSSSYIQDLNGKSNCISALHTHRNAPRADSTNLSLRPPPQEIYIKTAYFASECQENNILPREPLHKQHTEGLRSAVSLAQRNAFMHEHYHRSLQSESRGSASPLSVMRAGAAVIGAPEVPQTLSSAPTLLRARRVGLARPASTQKIGSQKPHVQLSQSNKRKIEPSLVSSSSTPAAELCNENVNLSLEPGPSQNKAVTSASPTKTQAQTNPPVSTFVGKMDPVVSIPQWTSPFTNNQTPLTLKKRRVGTNPPIQDMEECYNKYAKSIKKPAAALQSAAMSADYLIPDTNFETARAHEAALARPPPRAPLLDRSDTDLQSIIEESSRKFIERFSCMKSRHFQEVASATSSVLISRDLPAHSQFRLGSSPRDKIFSIYED